MKRGAAQDCQKMQAESPEQLQKDILNIEHTDHVNRGQIQKNAEIFNSKEELENKCIAGEKKKKKEKEKASFLYVLLVCVHRFSMITYKAQRCECRYTSLFCCLLVTATCSTHKKLGTRPRKNSDIKVKLFDNLF